MPLVCKGKIFSRILVAGVMFCVHTQDHYLKHPNMCVCVCVCFILFSFSFSLEEVTSIAT